MNDFQQISTQLLSLRAVRARDASQIYWLNSDPRVWAHRPSGVHTSREQTQTQVTGYLAAWDRDGLGCWTARTHDGTFVGIGGCSVKEGVGWNVYCRLLPEVQGRGYEAELVRAAVIAASVVRPELPIVFLILEHNESSKAAARGAGLAEVWRGSDEDDEDPGAVRLAYADRELPADVIETLRAHSKPGQADPALQQARPGPDPARPVPEEPPVPQEPPALEVSPAQEEPPALEVSPAQEEPLGPEEPPAPEESQPPGQPPSGQGQPGEPTAGQAPPEQERPGRRRLRWAWARN